MSPRQGHASPLGSATQRDFSALLQVLGQSASGGSPSAGCSDVAEAPPPHALLYSSPRSETLSHQGQTQSRGRSPILMLMQRSVPTTPFQLVWSRAILAKEKYQQGV